MSGISETYELNGATYTLRTMPATRALPLSIKLLNLIGGGAGNLDLGELMELKDKKNLENKEVLNGLMGILKSLDADDFMYIVNSSTDFIFVKGSGCDKVERCNLDKHFTGKTLDLLKVMVQFLKYNFKDFFSGSLLSS